VNQNKGKNNMKEDMTKKKLESTNYVNNKIIKEK
jgi:hypothetical protein